MTEAQTDQTAPARRRKVKKRKATKAVATKTKATKAAGTAVAIDDPKKRQQLAAAQQPAPPATSFLAVIMRAATDPACDTGKMRELLDMQKQIEQREAEKAYTRAFLPLQEKLPIINRDGKIEVRGKDSSGNRTGPLTQSTPYSTYPNIMSVCKPIMFEHGFTFSSKIRPGAEGKIVVISTLRHIDGHCEESEFPLGADTTGSKNNAQGWGSSQQYGMRYNALALLNITTKALVDVDADGHQGQFQNAKGGALAEAPDKPETLTDDEAFQLRQKIDVCRVPLVKVLDHYTIKSVADLPRSLLATAIKHCDDYAANQERARIEREKNSGFPGDRPRGR